MRMKSVKLGKGKTFGIGVVDGNVSVHHNCHLNQKWLA